MILGDSTSVASSEVSYSDYAEYIVVAYWPHGALAPLAHSPSRQGHAATYRGPPALLGHA